MKGNGFMLGGVIGGVVGMFMSAVWFCAGVVVCAAMVDKIKTEKEFEKLHKAGDLS